MPNSQLHILIYVSGYDIEGANIGDYRRFVVSHETYNVAGYDIGGPNMGDYMRFVISH